MDFDDKALAKEVLAAVEPAWNETLRFLGRSDIKLEERLVVNVFETVAGYETAEQKLTKGRFKNNLCFSHFGTRAVYSALVPDGDASVRKALGASRHFLRQQAHEAVHVAVYALINNHRSHPNWLAEGMATLIAERISVAKGWTEAVEETPFYAQRFYLCQSLRRRGLLPGPRAVFQENLEHLNSNERYAIWWTLFRFLFAEHEGELQQVMKLAWGLGGGPRFTQRLYEKVRTVWDDAALDKIHDAYRTHVDGFAPRWREPHRTLHVDGKEWRQMAYRNRNAVAWRMPAVGSSYQVKAKVTIPASSNPQANIYVGKSDAGFFSIATRVGSGFTLLEYRSKDDKWINHWNVERKIKAGKPLSVDVTVDGSKITVRSKGKKIGDHTADRDLAGRWGVGVQSGGGARWKDVRCEEK